MIAEPAASAKFQVISQMSVGILDLKAQVKALAAQLEAERARANKAEAQVRQLEAQLTHPKKEVFTLSLPINNPEDRVKADAELAKKINDGWERFDSAYIGNSGERTIHYITLTRVAPVPAEPIQPATRVAVPATPDPAPKPKTVVPSAIVMADEPAAPTTALAVKPAAAAEAAFQSDLNAALLDKAEEIKRTNPFYGYQPRSFRSMMEARGARNQP